MTETVRTMSRLYFLSTPIKLCASAILPGVLTRPGGIFLRLDRSFDSPSALGCDCSGAIFFGATGRQCRLLVRSGQFGADARRNVDRSNISAIKITSSSKSRPIRPDRSRPSVWLKLSWDGGWTLWDNNCVHQTHRLLCAYGAGHLVPDQSLRRCRLGSR